MDKFKSQLAGFNFKTQIKNNIQIHQHSEQNIKVIKWKSPKKSCKVRFINVCFLKIWSKLQKCAEKNCESFPQTHRPQKKNIKNDFAGNVLVSSSLVVFFCCFIICFPVFFIFWGWTNSSRDSQGLISRPKKKRNIQIDQHSEQSIKVTKWKSPTKKVAKFGS